MTSRLPAIAAALLFGSSSIWLMAAQQQGNAANQIRIDGDDIAGIVASTRGPEAGVWVIAETRDTPTQFRKIVVTDEQGRYLLPDLPTKAAFSVWTRGYGLVDSAPVRSTPGQRLNLTARLAPDARTRSEERRVGKECRSRWAPDHYRKNS